MKLKRMTPWLLALIALTLLSLTGCSRSDAAPLRFDGSLELRSPVWASHGHPFFVPDPQYVAPSTVGHWEEHDFQPNLKLLDLAGSVRLHSDGSPLALWCSGEHSFSHGAFIHENKLKVGLDLALGRGPMTLFAFWDRRFDKDLDRAFVGLRCNFRGSLD